MSDRKQQLLLVDDDRLILATTAAGLRSAGYEVREASSVDAAMALLAKGEFSPDLALIDIRMSGRDGFDLARHLREENRVPFLFVSAYGDAPTVEEATSLGAVGFAVKPIDMPQLLPMVEAAIARGPDLRSLRDTGRQLEVALDQNRGVSVAIGILMERHHLDHDTAQRLLRERARAERRKLTDIAAEVVAACELLSRKRLGPEPG